MQEQTIVLQQEVATLQNQLALLQKKIQHFFEEEIIVRGDKPFNAAYTSFFELTR